MKIALLSLVICLLPTHLPAAVLSLDECLVQVRSNNPALRTARTDTQVATEMVTQSDASLYPRIDAQGGYTAQLEAQAMKVNGQTLETQQPSYAFAGLGVNYTLYDFGRRDARRAAARGQLNVVQLGISQQEQDTILQATQTYLAILEAQQNVAAGEDELKTVEAHLRVAQALYEAGSATRNDLLQAEVRRATANQQLLAQRNVVTNLYLRLNFLRGATAHERPELLEPLMPSAPPQHAPDTSKALQKRPDLQALRKSMVITEQDVRESKAAFYPELFARLSLDYLENSKLREQALYAGTIGLKVNLFDGFSSTAGKRKAMAAQIQAQERLRLAEEQTKLEIATARNDLAVAYQRIGVTKEAIRQGEENLRINRDRYQERVGTATEVLDAQTLLTQSRTEHYRAIYDYQLAVARLRRATGEL